MNNLFNPADFFEESLGTGGSRIPVGIHQNVTFNGMFKDQKWYDIRFTDDTGRLAQKRLFTEVKPKDGETMEDAIARHAKNNLPHVVKLLRIFLGDEAAKNIRAETYEAFMQQALIFLAGCQGRKVNLKVVYDKDGVYPDLPYMPTYVELYVPGQASTLEFTPAEADKIAAGPQPKKGAKTSAPTPQVGGDFPF